MASADTSNNDGEVHMRSTTPARVITQAIRRNEVSADLPGITLTSRISATRGGSENRDNHFSMTHSNASAGGSESDSEPEADLPDIPYSDSPVDRSARATGPLLQQSANQTDTRVSYNSSRPSDTDTLSIIRAPTSKSVLDAVIAPALSVTGRSPRYSSRPMPVSRYFTSRHQKLQPQWTRPPSTVVQDTADEVQVLTRSSSVRVTEPSNQPSITKAPTPVHQAPTTINAREFPNRESPSIFISQPEAKSPIVKSDPKSLETELTTLQTGLRLIRTQLSAQNRKLENVSISRNKAIQRSSVLGTRRRTLLTKRKWLEDRITSNRDDIAQQKTIIQRTGTERDKVMQETDRVQGELDHLMSRSREIRRKMGLSEERIRQEEMCDQKAWSSMEGDDAVEEENRSAESMSSASGDNTSIHGDSGSELRALPQLAMHDNGLAANFRGTVSLSGSTSIAVSGTPPNPNIIPSPNHHTPLTISDLSTIKPILTVPPQSALSIDETDSATQQTPPETIDISQLNQHIKTMEDHRMAAEILLNRYAELKKTSALDLLTTLLTPLPTTTTPTKTTAVSKKRRIEDVVLDTDTDTDDDWIHKTPPNKPSRGPAKRKKTAEGTHSASERSDDAVAEDLLRRGEREKRMHALCVLNQTGIDSRTEANGGGKQSDIRNLCGVGIDSEREMLMNKKSGQSKQSKQKEQKKKRAKREINDPVGAAKTGASYWFC